MAGAGADEPDGFVTEEGAGPVPIEPQWLLMQVNMQGGHQHTMIVRAAAGRDVSDRLADRITKAQRPSLLVDITGHDTAQRSIRLVTSLAEIVSVQLVILPPAPVETYGDEPGRYEGDAEDGAETDAERAARPGTAVAG